MPTMKDKTEVRVAAVTGAAGGLGLGIARRLAEAGHRVIAIDRAARVEAEAALLRAEGLKVEAQVLDIADEAAVRRMVADVDARHGRLDILVNNAGIHPKIDGERNSFLKMSTSQWNEVLGINLTAAFVLCREIAPLMRRRRWGRIVNMSSRAGRTLVDTAGIHYAAAKAGMIGMTRVIAAEVAGDGITANCIAPGRIASPMTDQGSEAQRALLVARIPVGRIGTPAEIGHVVEFLVSEESGYLTGTVIDVNGGTFMC
jgi:3-oxoacyl-[acyl-carrier protein] reductase